MEQRIKAVWQRIEAAAAKSGRSKDAVRLVAVSKTVPIQKIERAVSAGVTIIGENYIQEAREKFHQLYEMPVSWHFIGHLQRNKARHAVEMFDLIHSVDSLRLAVEIDKQAHKIDKIQEVLIQVNLAGEATKSGTSIAAASDLIREAAHLEYVSIKGLMTMPPFFNAPERVRPYFRRLRQMRDDLRAQGIPGIEMTELSMGMTGDFEVAVQEGATLVRIGTAIFGERR